MQVCCTNYVNADLLVCALASTNSYIQWFFKK